MTCLLIVQIGLLRSARLMCLNVAVWMLFLFRRNSLNLTTMILLMVVRTACRSFVISRVNRRLLMTRNTLRTTCWLIFVWFRVDDLRNWFRMLEFSLLLIGFIRFRLFLNVGKLHLLTFLRLSLFRDLSSPRKCRISLEQHGRIICYSIIIKRF